MRSFIGFFLIVWSSETLLAGFTPDTTPRSGFALVTLVSGNVAGLVGTETLRNRTGSGIEQAVMPPSPLVTTASILVPVGAIGENTTAIAIANPSIASGGVNLILTDNIGTVVLNVVVQLGPRGQLAKYLNEFFATQAVAFSTPLLLTVSSEIPVSIVAFNFRGEEFASIPLVSLSAPIPIAVQPLSIETCSTPTTLPTAASGFGLGVAPSPPCSIIGEQTVTPPSAVQPGFGLGLPPATPSTAIFFTPPVTVSNAPVPTVTSATAIGGTGTLVFPQVVTGGAWSTDIVLGNTSAGTQTVRIDFFSPDGFVTGSLTDITIPARGVFFFSSEVSATTGN